MYIKYDGMVRDQHSFDVYNKLNDNPQMKWNGRVGLYHQVIAEQIQEMPSGIRLLTKKLDNIEIEPIRIESIISENQKKLTQEIVDCFSGWIRNKESEECSMKVSYNGFTGTLVKLEYSNSELGLVHGVISYNLDIFDSDKNATHSFRNIDIRELRFLNGTMSFNDG